MLGIADARSPFTPLSQIRAISSTQRRPDRPFGYECFCREERSPFIYTRCQKSDRPLGISQKVRSLFGYFWLYGKGDRSFWYGKGDRSFFI
ncbi:MAG: hypothetical protein HC894_20115 [Microcoleus sp. SM1_3_4]|nr:hypothetical protein [Microcoleus sp. SM1_3_4]